MNKLLYNMTWVGKSLKFNITKSLYRNDQKIEVST